MPERETGMSIASASPLPVWTGSHHNVCRGGGGGIHPRSRSPVSIEGEFGVDRGEHRDQLLSELYGELRARAERFMRGQPRDLTLQTTALVHEACLKIFGQERLEGADKNHILALASTAMRTVLVDHARARGRVKRLPPGERVPLDDVQELFDERAVDLLALDEALRKLASFDEQMLRVVE